MNRLLHTALAVVVACATTACSWLEEEPVPADNLNAPRLVGRIASIPPDRKFVLIESYGKWSIPPGSILTVLGPDKRSANLIATGEVLRHHAAADIQSGNLEVGDGVYTTAKPVEEPQPAASSAAQQKNDPMVKKPLKSITQDQ